MLQTDSGMMESFWLSWAMLSGNYTALVEQLHYDIVPHGHLSHGGRSFAVLLVSCNQEGNSHRHARSLSMLV